MKILGFSYDLPISSLCYLKDGKIEFAIAEERLNRIKNYKGFPELSLSYVLKKFNLKIKDIDFFVNSWNPAIYFRKFNPLISQQKRHFSEQLISFPDNLLKKQQKKYIGNTNLNFLLNKKNINFEFITHHECHAGLAFYLSGFKNAIAFIVDQQGETMSSSVWTINNNKFTKVFSTDFPNSIGKFYASITEYLGFKPLSDEWKVMALGAYSKNYSETYKKLKKIININNNGTFDLDTNYFNLINEKENLLSEKFYSIFGGPRNNEDKLKKMHYDIAASLQKIVEETIISMISKFLKKYPHKNLCLSGGVFMNSVMNGKIAEKFKNNNIYIPYAPDDSGNSIGAALFKYFANSKRKNYHYKKNSLPYKGCSYNSKNIEKILKKFKIKYRKEKNLNHFICKSLENKKVIAYFQGNMEFGQRALGSRSIIASPKFSSMKKTVNESIKYRESFRPFAPAVLDKHVTKIFKVSKKHKSDYMEKVFFFKDKYKKKYPAVVHADGSGRIMTVNENSNFKFKELLDYYEKKFNCPIILNTSFNVKGEPIVESPESAIKTFFSSGLDILILEDFIVEK